MNYSLLQVMLSIGENDSDLGRVGEKKTVRRLRSVTDVLLSTSTHTALKVSCVLCLRINAVNSCCVLSD